MKLYYSPASPFARKVLVLANETGQTGAVEQINPGALSPLNPNGTVIDSNPLGKIPALVLADGRNLSDSSVICEYLDSLHSGPKMFPTDSDQRFAALTTQSLADGVLDTLVLLRYETFLRPEEKRWDEWITRQQDRTVRVLDNFTEHCPQSSSPLNIGTIAVACVLGYLDFRFAESDWRESRGPLAAWYDTFSKRPSMRATAPE